MSAITARFVQTSFHSVGRAAGLRKALAVIVLASCLLVGLPAAVGFAGQSATGQLAFYPCTQCHPVTLADDGSPAKPLPIGMSQHTIELEVHDILGEGDAACLACHDEPSRDPGMLLLADGSLVEVTGDVSRVCQRCHFEKYREWEDGIHGKDAPKCSAAGCHDPHSPSWIYMASLPPFQGTGVEILAVGNRRPFQPLAAPPLDPPVYTPLWLSILTALGGLVALATLGYLVLGKVKR